MPTIIDAGLTATQPSTSVYAPATFGRGAGVGGIGLADSPGAVSKARGGLLVVPHETHSPSYVLNFGPLAPTAAMNIFQIQGVAPSPVVRLRRIVLFPGVQTTAGVILLQLGVESGIGTGGTAGIGASMHNTLLGNYNGTIVTGSTPGTISVTWHAWPVLVPAALTVGEGVEMVFGPTGKTWSPAYPINGAQAIVMKHPGAAGAASLSGFVEFTRDNS